MKKVIADGKEYVFLGVSSAVVASTAGLRVVKHFIHCVNPKTNDVIVFEHDKCKFKAL